VTILIHGGQLERDAERLIHETDALSASYKLLFDFGHDTLPFMDWRRESVSLPEMTV
jgi:hypothetical protein